MSDSYEAAYQKGCSDTFKTFYEIRKHRDELLEAIEIFEKERNKAFALLDWIKLHKRSVLCSMTNRESKELADLMHEIQAGS